MMGEEIRNTAHFLLFIHMVILENHPHNLYGIFMIINFTEHFELFEGPIWRVS